MIEVLFSSEKFNSNLLILVIFERKLFQTAYSRDFTELQKEALLKASFWYNSGVIFGAL